MVTGSSTTLDTTMGAPLIERLASIQLVLMDVDGVLTDGRFYLLPDPTSPDRTIETKAFDSQDGIALQWLRQFDISAGLISGRESVATAERARTAGFDLSIKGTSRRKQSLRRSSRNPGLTQSRLCILATT